MTKDDCSAVLALSEILAKSQTNEDSLTKGLNAWFHSTFKHPFDRENIDSSVTDGSLIVTENNFRALIVNR